VPPEALLFGRARGSGPCGLSDLHSFASFGRAAGSGTPPYPSRFRAPRGDFLFFNNLGLDRLKTGSNYNKLSALSVHNGMGYSLINGCEIFHLKNIFVYLKNRKIIIY